MHVQASKDASVLAALNRFVHEVHAMKYPEFFKPYDYEGVKSYFEGIVGRPEYEFLVLFDELGAEALAYAWIEIRDYPENVFKRPYRALYVHQLSVDDKARHRGCGKTLMAEVERIARERSCTQIELDYWCENEGAGIFYKKLGFDVAREVTWKPLSADGRST